MDYEIRRGRTTRRRRVIGLLLAGTVLSSTPLRAQVVYGDGVNELAPLVLGADTQLLVATGAATQSGIVSDGGNGFGIIKMGAGALTLSGANTYSGGTTISQGAISVSADDHLGDAAGGLSFGGGSLIATGSFSSSRLVTLQAGGGTIDTQSNTVTLSGDISGSGGLTKQGAGDLVFDGFNASYGGVTRIEQGRLIADGMFGSTSAASLHEIAAGATLRITDNVFFADVGLLSGAGRVEIRGSAALSTGNIAGTAIFSGVIDGASGSGSLGVFGPGTQVLTGQGSALGGDLQICSCSTGGIVLRGGSLSVAGTIGVQGGTLRIEQGGVLSGGAPVQLAGTFVVDGAGSSATTGNLLALQPGAVTVLTVSGGAALTTQGVSLDASAGGSVTATVTGQNSIWTVDSFGGVSVGLGGSRPVSLTVSDGGTLVTEQIAIASNGALQIGQGGLGGTIRPPGVVPVTILNDGRIVADFTDAVTLAANIEVDSPDEAGTLTKRGSGVLTLTGTNTYRGNTTIEGGVLSVESNANLGGAASALVLNGGVLRVTGTAFTQTPRPISFGAAGGGFDIADAANTFTVTQSFGGTGSFSKAGLGALVLTGAHSYTGATTVSGGTLQAGAAGAFSPNSAFTVASGATLALGGFSQSIGSLAGAGAAALGAATLTTGADNSSTTFSGPISGTGGLVKAGSGSMTLTGASPFTGATSVTGGMLVVNGSLAGSVVTVAGGTLGGSGTVGGINAVSGAVAPGNSIGTLAVSGNVAFGPGSTYRVEVNAAGAADRINATGTALLTGGLVQVLAEQGDYALSTRYVILAAQGGVAGTFSSLTSNLAFLSPSLSYGATEVVLTLARNDVAFAAPAAGSATPASGSAPAGSIAPAATRYVAITRNQTGVGRAAEALGAGNRVYDALISSTIAEARAGFDALSGEAHAQAVFVAIETSHLVREAVLNRLRAPFETSASLGSVQGAFSADLPGRKGGVALPAPRIEAHRVTLWGEAVGTAGRSNGDGNAASLERRAGGMLAGAEIESNGVSPWRAGALVGFTRSHFDLDARRSSGTQDSVHAALYGGARLGAVSLRAGAAYAWNETDLTRQVLLRGFSDVLRHDGNGSTLQGFAELGYGLQAGSVAFEPFAQIAWVHVRSEAGTEQGGAAALRVAGYSQNLGFGTLGLRAEAQIGGMPLFARGMVGWRHAFGETLPSAQLAFASGGGGAFRVHAAALARDALVAEAGVSWRVTGMTSLGVAYSAALGESQRDHALKGRIDVRF